jgi:hypothetical protein
MNFLIAVHVAIVDEVAEDLAITVKQLHLEIHLHCGLRHLVTRWPLAGIDLSLRFSAIRVRAAAAEGVQQTKGKAAGAYMEHGLKQCRVRWRRCHCCSRCDNVMEWYMRVLQHFDH